jgi:hypothetical protein
VHEYLTAVVATEEAEAFVGVIPFDLASGHEQTSRGIAAGRFTRKRHPRLVAPARVWSVAVALVTAA